MNLKQGTQTALFQIHGLLWFVTACNVIFGVFVVKAYYGDIHKR